VVARYVQFLTIFFCQLFTSVTSTFCLYLASFLSERVFTASAVHLPVIFIKFADIVISADSRQLAETLSEMMWQTRVRLSKGQSGRFYSICFDNMSEEPFRAIALQESCADKRVKNNSFANIVKRADVNNAGSSQYSDRHYSDHCYSDRHIWFCNSCLLRRRITVTLIPKQKT
jgi:hypothetical protein